MSNKFLLTVVMLAATLAGCAHYQAQPIEPKNSAAAFQARSLTNPELRAFLETNRQGAFPTWPLPSWDFTNLVLAAFYYNSDLDLARARWAVARAGRSTAAEHPNPTLSVAPAYNTTTAIPSPWLVTPTLDIPIETAGKRGYRLAEATQLSEAARLNLASVAWQVRGRVRNGLGALYVARKTEALLKEQQSLQAENAHLLEKQHEAGAISSFELTQARLAADAARLALCEAERQTAEARSQLADVIGIPVAGLESVPLSFSGVAEPPSEVPSAAVLRQALFHRTDILGALAQYAASQSALQLEIAKQYPDIHLSPGYEFDQGDNKWSLGLSVSLPVLNRNQGAIAEAAAKRAESAAGFEALQARVISETERALTSFRLTLQKKADSDAILTRLEEQERRAQAMFEAGDISRTDLAALRLQLSASALARLDALGKSQQAFGLLEDALQSPLGLPDSTWQNSPRISPSTK